MTVVSGDKLHGIEQAVEGFRRKEARKTQRQLTRGGPIHVRGAQREEHVICGSLILTLPPPGCLVVVV